MRKLIYIIWLALIVGCSNQKEQPQNYQKELIEKEKNIRKLSYISKYRDYFIRRKIPLVIAGQVTKTDPFQNQWIFIVNSENNEQVMIDLTQIPTANRPKLAKDDPVKFFGPIVKDESLLTDFHMQATAYISEPEKSKSTE